MGLKFDYELLGRTVNDFREGYDSDNEMASELGCSPDDLLGIINAAVTPSIDFLITFCDAWGLHPADFIEETHD